MLDYAGHKRPGLQTVPGVLGPQGRAVGPSRGRGSVPRTGRGLSAEGRLQSSRAQRRLTARCWSVGRDCGKLGPCTRPQQGRRLEKDRAGRWGPAGPARPGRVSHRPPAPIVRPGGGGSGGDGAEREEVEPQGCGIRRLRPPGRVCAARGRTGARRPRPSGEGHGAGRPAPAPQAPEPRGTAGGGWAGARAAPGVAGPESGGSGQAGILPEREDPDPTLLPQGSPLGPCSAPLFLGGQVPQ